MIKPEPFESSRYAQAEHSPVYEGIKFLRSLLGVLGGVFTWALRGTLCSRHLFCLLLWMSARVGEASHPGPQDPWDDDGCFNIGAMNPTGLNGKAAYCAGLPPGILGVSESHLSSKGVAQFRLGLKLSHARHRYLAGAHVPLRAHSFSSGGYSGVGFLSTVPQRSLPQSWPEDLWNTARLQVASFFVDPFWVQGAILYGYATAPSKTHTLLDAVTQRIVHQASGPRFIVGDFNLTPDSLPHAHEWVRHGFQEVQTLASHRWGQAPQATCKGTSRKDMLWVSPELQALLRRVDVVNSWFPDHSLLIAKFAGGSQWIPRLLWRMPQPLEVPGPIQEAQAAPSLHSSSASPPCGALHLHSVEHSHQQQVDPSLSYLKLWNEFEASAAFAAAQTGGPPVRPDQTGRGATVDTVLVKAEVAPPRTGRQGELGITFYGLNQQMARFVKQLRRVQAFKQALIRPSDAPLALEGRQQLWQAIISAKGFKPSFRDWWRQRPVCLPGDPHYFPATPPTSEVADLLFLSLQKNVEFMEGKLKSSRRQYAKARRQADPALLFRDLKGERPAHVESLVEGPKAVVEEVLEADGVAVLVGETSWIPSAPFLRDDSPFEVHHAEPDCLYGDVKGLQKGCTVRQLRCIGDLPGLFKAFAEEWTARWVKVDHLTPGRWEAVLQTFPDLPPCVMAYPPITVQSWRQAVRDKPRHAKGPDGVTREDLLGLPDHLVLQMLALYKRAEQTGVWPRQLIVGIVSSLAKTESASAVQHYRPITVFALSYRVWSSIRARQALRHIASFAPPGLSGGLPGTGASDVWWSLQREVEQALVFGEPLVGASVDLSKAFNNLPRTPIFALALKAGLPQELVRAWVGAVTAGTRRFRVRDSIGPPLVACSGFAEGDPLSVVAMTLTDIALQAFVSKQAPGATVTTYMDDWKSTAGSTAQLTAAIQATEKFADVWDLQVDVAKTVTWGTSQALRSELRAAGLPVALASRDLGGQSSSTFGRTNSVLKDRIRSLDDIWPRLASSLAPYSAKVRALKVAAWPKALYAVSTVQLGSQHFQALRSGAMKGLNARKPGANPLLHLSLLEYPASDPAFFALRSSFLDLLRHGSREAFAPVAAELLSSARALETGPVSALLARCHEVGISWCTSSNSFCDRWGNFCPFLIAPQELELRLVSSWQSAVAAKVAHRPGFEGLERADPWLCRHILASYPVDQQASLRVVLNGSFYTEDSLHHVGESDLPLCPCCGARDSIYHRTWVCPKLQEARKRALQGFPLEPSLLAPCLAHHAWVQLPESIDALWQEHLKVAEPAPVFLYPPSHEKQLELFTDGTCLLPCVPCLRVAGWAVTSAVLEGSQAQVIASGPLPGLLQSAFRAEIMAVLVALQCALRHDGSARIWSDCLGVIKRVQGLVQGAQVPRTGRNADLWCRVQEHLEALGSRFMGIFKVDSHQNFEEAEDEVTRWLYYNNQLADRAAARANEGRSPLFWQVWNTVRKEWSYQKLLGERVFAVHAAIAKAIRDYAKGGQRKAAALLAVSHDQAPMARILEAPVCSEDLLRAVYVKYGRPFVSTLLAWIRLVTNPSQVTGEACWISFAQLYVAFVAATGFRPPLYRVSRKQWYCVGDDPVLLLREIPFHRRVTWFQGQVKDCVQAAGGFVAARQIRPKSELLQVRLSSTFLRLLESVYVSTEDILCRHLSTSCTRHDTRWKVLAL